MVTSNTRKTSALAILIFLAALLQFAPAVAQSDWRTYTSLAQVNSFRVINDTVFAATSGGLLAVYDPSTPGETYTNLDGFGTVDLTDIIRDGDGVTWITGAGRLIRLTSDGPRQFLTGPTIGPRRLLTVADDNDLLWLGSDSGLVLFSKVNDNGQFENRFRLTTVNQFPPVFSVALSGDSIWCATSVGLVVADRTDPRQIVSPLAWTLYSTVSNPELGTSEIVRVTEFGGDIFVGNATGLYRLDNRGPAVAFVKDPVVGSRSVSEMVMQQDTLLVFASGSIFELHDGTTTPQPPAGIAGLAVRGVGNSQAFWVATNIGGIYAGSPGSFEDYPFVGLPENNVAGVGVTSDGTVRALLDTRGLASLQGDRWDVLSLDVGRRATKLHIDGNDGIWVGTFYNGAWLVTADAMAQYSSFNSPLTPEAPVISGIASGDGRIYLSVLLPSNGASVSVGNLAALDDRDAWDSIGVLQDLNDNLVISLDYRDGRLAAATDNNGVFVCQPGQNCAHYTEAVNRLPSDVTRVVRIAPDGALWVGTNFGLAREAIELGLPILEQVQLPEGIGPDIAALRIDSRGNAWIGARNGLAYYDQATGIIDAFTIENSGLVGNEIRDLALDPVTGDLVIATTGGLSIYNTATGPPIKEVDRVLAFPNPFVIESADDRLRFAFERPAVVDIFSTAGELVKTLSVNEAWDGRNGSGEDVASGIYLFVVTDTDGNTGRGKFLLVRQ
jgi:ligand-binding sensor domain-containing protein